jgi:hypothetical protein
MSFKYKVLKEVETEFVVVSGIHLVGQESHDKPQSGFLYADILHLKHS